MIVSRQAGTYGEIAAAALPELRDEGNLPIHD